ncbi:MAG: hypothetical protein MK101_06145 [Phycisphaerales bacterium]|nr:hypothetical protein [Phycisphaerales bacterium]
MPAILTVALACAMWAAPSGGPAPIYAARDAARIIDRLGLEGAQDGQIIELLLVDYETQWAQAAASLRSDLTSFKDGPTSTALSDRLIAFNQTQLALASILQEHMDLLLEPEDQAKWTRLQHELLMERRLKYGQLAGESLDLRSITRDLGAEVASASTIGAWEADLAHLLQRRTAYDIGGPSRVQALMLAGQFNEALEWMQGWIDARVAIRDANLSYVKLLQTTLPAQQAAALADVVERATRLHVRDGRAVDVLAAAVAADPSITEAVKAAVARTLQGYQQRTELIHEQREALERRLEPEMLLAPIQQRLGRDDVFRRLKQEQADNEARLSAQGEATIEAICSLIGEAHCHRLLEGVDAVNRRDHPSGLPGPAAPPSGSHSDTDSPLSPPQPSTPPGPFLPDTPDRPEGPVAPNPHPPMPPPA